jgi:hypothetical protein
MAARVQLKKSLVVVLHGLDAKTKLVGGKPPDVKQLSSVLNRSL